MSLEIEAVLDRRRMRRRLSSWRALAVVAVVAAIAVLTLDEDAGVIGERRQIARISIEGMITESRDQLRLLDRVGEAKNVAGVILFVNSPGGTTTGGEALYEGLRKLSAKKPVVAQFGTVAASAAYIAGLGTDHIIARGNTITGSVGVIFQWPEVSQLLDKLGVKMNEIKSGPLKATPSPYQPLDEPGRRVAEQMVADSQRWFLGLVSSRRGVTTPEVPGLEQGRVYSGREALVHKLVDEIGGEAEARRWLEEKRSVPAKLKIVDWKPRQESDWSLPRASAWIASLLLGTRGEALLTELSVNGALGRMRLDGLVSIWLPSEN